MLAAIDFDNEFLGQAGEVYDVGAYRHLSTEAESRELSLTKKEPEPAFGIGCVA